VRAESTVEPIPVDERAKMIQLALIALGFSGVPLDTVKNYELFNTVYYYRDGSIVLESGPYISGDEVLDVVYGVKQVKDMYESGKLQYVTQGSTTIVLWNGTEILRIEAVNGDTGWTIYAEPLYNKTLDSSTTMSWRRVYANYSGYIAEYVVILLSRKVNTANIYVATVAEKSGDKYLYAFTYANYWIDGKSMFFGDWIVLPEGAPTLADYLNIVANGVIYLYATYIGALAYPRYPSTDVAYTDIANPEYSSTGYVPSYMYSAYLQIANALNTLAKNIPQELNLGVGKGYALVTDDSIWDIIWNAIKNAIAGAILGAIGATGHYTTYCVIKGEQWSWRAFGTEVAAGAVGGALMGFASPFVQRLLLS